MQLLALLSVALINVLGSDGASKDPVLLQSSTDVLIEFSKDVTRLELVLPKPEQRNSLGCESYEDQVYDDCHINCAAQLSLFGTFILDPGVRRLDICQPRGSYCRKVMASRDGLNITVAGYCDHCSCVTSSSFTHYWAWRVDELCKASSPETTTVQPPAQLSHSTGKRVLPKIRIPHPSVRNATACEPYESSYSVRPSSLGEEPNGCIQQCNVDLLMGRLRVKSQVRTLNGKLRANGQTCYLKPLKNEWLSVEGARMVVRGKCDGGVCVLADPRDLKNNQEDARQQRIQKMRE